MKRNSAAIEVMSEAVREEHKRHFRLVAERLRIRDNWIRYNGPRHHPKALVRKSTWFSARFHFDLGPLGIDGERPWQPRGGYSRYMVRVSARHGFLVECENGVNPFKIASNKDRPLDLRDRLKAFRESMNRWLNADPERSHFGTRTILTVIVTPADS